MNKTGSISREATKCRTCSKRDSCNKKRMELCAYIIPRDILTTKISSSISENMSQSLMRETMLINDGRGNMVRVYKDEIEKQIYKNLNVCQINLEYGA